MGVYIPYTRLPSAYQEVEYIESSGTQYIDTGIKGSNTISAELVLRPNVSHISENGFFGDKWDSTAFNVLAYGSKFTINNGGNSITGPTITDMKYTIKATPTGLIVNGTTYGVNAGSSYNSYNIGLFSMLDNYGLNRKGWFKAYSFKIWNGSTLVRDFVPCYRKSDSVIGMYELVNNQFYTNGGTGTFTKGADVYMSDLKNAYIGEYRVPGENTIAYYEFNGNLNDSSGNGHNLTNSGTISYNTSPIAVNLSTSNYLYFNNSDTFNHDWTYNTWAYITARNQYNEATTLFSQGTGATNSMIFCSIDYQGKLFMGFYNDDHTGTITSSLNQWVNVCYTYNYATKTYKAYINGVKDIDGTKTTQYTIASGNLYVGALANVPSNLGYRVQGKLSEYIIENKARTADEVLNYYNLTKSNYGL